MKRNDVPGPGQYSNMDSHNYKFAYTKEIRSKDMKKGDPGPGRTYRKHHRILNSSKCSKCPSLLNRPKYLPLIKQSLILVHYFHIFTLQNHSLTSTSMIFFLPTKFELPFPSINLPSPS